MLGEMTIIDDRENENSEIGYEKRLKKISKYAVNKNVERDIVDRLIEMIDNRELKPIETIAAIRAFKDIMLLARNDKIDMKFAPETIPSTVNFVVTSKVDD